MRILINNEIADITDYHEAAKDICQMADTDFSALAIAGHEQGYVQIIVHLDDDGVIDDAFVREAIDEYYRSSNGEWHCLLSVGTGSCSCNCEACEAGEDPEDWAAAEAEEMWEYFCGKLQMFDDYLA